MHIVPQACVRLVGLQKNLKSQDYEYFGADTKTHYSSFICLELDCFRCVLHYLIYPLLCSLFTLLCDISSFSECRVGGG